MWTQALRTRAEGWTEPDGIKEKRRKRAGVERGSGEYGDPSGPGCILRRWLTRPLVIPAHALLCCGQISQPSECWRCSLQRVRFISNKYKIKGREGGGEGSIPTGERFYSGTAWLQEHPPPPPAWPAFIPPRVCEEGIKCGNGNGPQVYLLTTPSPLITPTLFYSTRHTFGSSSPLIYALNRVCFCSFQYFFPPQNQTSEAVYTAGSVLTYSPQHRAERVLVLLLAPCIRPGDLKKSRRKFLHLPGNAAPVEPSAVGLHVIRHQARHLLRESE